MFKMSPLVLGVPLLHCSVNDTLFSRIPRCQNMFTKLIDVLDLMLVQVYNPLLWNLLRNSCTKNNHYCHFGYMQNYSFSRYSGYISQVWWTELIVTYFKFFSGFYVPKIIKIGSFLIELLKIKNVVAFWDTVYWCNGVEWSFY